MSEVSVEINGSETSNIVYHSVEEVLDGAKDVNIAVMVNRALLNGGNNAESNGSVQQLNINGNSNENESNGDIEVEDLFGVRHHVESDIRHEENAVTGPSAIEELPRSVEEAVAEFLKNQGVRKFTLRLEPASCVGENSYGTVTRIEVTKVSSVDEVHGNPLPDEQIHFIAKVSPKNPARRLQMKVVEYYVREVFMYEHVLNAYKQLQDECNIPSLYAFNSIPRMYHYSLQDNDEFIIFEDLQKSGYSMFNRRNSISYEHTELTLREIAKFHAMSFVTRDRKPELFKSFVQKIREDNLFSDKLEQISIDFARKYINKTIDSINEQRIPNRNVILNKVITTRENFKTLGKKMVDGEAAAPYAVICHGDFWNNNVMFKYDESGTPISAKLIDFQMSRYASPVLDFLHYVFSCTEKDLRDKYFQQMKLAYHESLSSHLRLFGMDPEVTYSNEKFEEHLREYGVYGFLISIYAMPFIISDGSDLPNLDEVSELLRSNPGSSDSLDTNSLNGNGDNGSDGNSCNDATKDIQFGEGVCTFTGCSELSFDNPTILFNVDAEQASSTDENEEVSSAQRNAVLDNYEILTDDTTPVFKRRMTGIVVDLERYGMFNV